MNLQLKWHQITLKAPSINFKIERQLKKSFNFNELSQKRERGTEKSEFGLIGIGNTIKSQSAQNNLNKELVAQSEVLMSASQSMEQNSFRPHCISLKRNQDEFNDLFAVSKNHSQENKINESPSNISLLSPKKQLYFDSRNNKWNPLRQNNRPKRLNFAIPIKQRLQLDKKVSRCIDNMIQLSKLTQKLTKVQINATQNIKTQSKSVSFIQMDEFKISQDHPSKLIKRKDLFADFLGLKHTIHNRSFSPTNLERRNLTIQKSLIKKEKNLLFKDRFNYLQVKGQSKTIANCKSQEKTKRKIILTKIQRSPGQRYLRANQ